jgi:hypothetical protein
MKEKKVCEEGEKQEETRQKGKTEESKMERKTGMKVQEIDETRKNGKKEEREEPKEGKK